MTSNVVESETSPVMPAEFLEMLHATGVQLAGHPESLWRKWGRHMLDDWRALDVLLAERRR